MASSLYEIVMLPDGEVVLQRTNEDGEPLIRISFSDEAKYYLRDTRMDVAKAMIDAGIDVVERMSSDDLLLEDEDMDNRILH
tara:strand:- start:11809 stop:12054 length:246 start_codon:yes stop_codon:yes gene_type:complete